MSGHNCYRGPDGYCPTCAIATLTGRNAALQKVVDETSKALNTFIASVPTYKLIDVEYLRVVANLCLNYVSESLDALPKDVPVKHREEEDATPSKD